MTEFREPIPPFFIGMFITLPSFMRILDNIPQKHRSRFKIENGLQDGVLGTALSLDRNISKKIKRTKRLRKDASKSS